MKSNVWKQMVLCGVVLCVVSGVQAVFVGYDPQGSELPDASWVLSGEVDPIASVSNGIALIQTDNNPDVGRYERATAFNNATGYTVDFGYREGEPYSDWQGGYQITIREDNVDLGEIRVFGKGDTEGMGAVRIMWEGGGPDPKVDIPLGWHDFRFARLGNHYELWMDGVKTPIISATAPASFDPNSTTIGFGDYGSANRFTADLDYIVFDESQAIFDRPIVPEPSTAVILLCGLSMLIARRGR